MEWPLPCAKRLVVLLILIYFFPILRNRAGVGSLDVHRASLKGLYCSTLGWGSVGLSAPRQGFSMSALGCVCSSRTRSAMSSPCLFLGSQHLLILWSTHTKPPAISPGPSQLCLQAELPHTLLPSVEKHFLFRFQGQNGFVQSHFEKSLSA